MSSAFAQHLQDFGSGSGLSQIAVMPQANLADQAAMNEPSIDVEAEKAASYQEGHAAACETLNAEHAAQMEAVTQAHQEEMDRRESEFFGKMSQDLMNGLASQIDQVSQDIKAELSVILMQIIEKDIVSNSLEKLTNIIQSTLNEDPNSKFDISGPAQLIDQIKANFEDNMQNINLTESEETDLTVELDQSILKTRLSEWNKSFGDELS